jgi:putative MATE family efflux protein
MVTTMTDDPPIAAPAEIPADRLGPWATVRLALSGTELDFTRGPVGRAIILLSIPMVLEMVMESAFAITDAYFVSRLGVDAVATVGFTEAMITIVFAVGIGMAMATTAMVARRIGEGDRAGATVAAVQAIALGLAGTLVIAIPGVLLAADLLRLMGGSPELVAFGSGYTRVLLGGCGTIMLLFLINGVFRGAGDPALAMRVLWLANGCNILLDPCLIFGLGPFPELGITGAAVATTIGRGVGVAYQLWMLARGTGRIQITAGDLRLVPRVMGRLARVSVGGILQFLIETSSWIVLVWIIGKFGSAAVAGYTIAIRIIVFTILPSWGVANSAATLMGQNLGAGQPDRAETSVWRAALYNLVFLVGVAVVFIIWAEPMIRIFSTDPEVVRSGVACLRWVSYGYGFFAYGMVMVQAFNGAGDTTTPTIINFFCFWMVQIPLAYLLATGTELGATGVFITMTVAESLMAVAGIVVFRRGRWRAREI